MFVKQINIWICHVHKCYMTTLNARLRKTEKGLCLLNPLTKRLPKEIKRAWNTAKKKAGIENFRFHDLRHTVATRLVNAGVPLPTLKRL